MNATTTLEAVQAWPVDEQHDFLFRAWDQLLEQSPPPAISDELRAELRRRVAAHEADPSRVLTWEQVEAFVRRAR